MRDAQHLTGATKLPVKPKFVVRFCSAVIKWTLLLSVFLIPLFFLPWTAEVTEINKQLLLFVSATAAGLAWLGKMLAERKLEYRRSIINAIVLLYLAVYAISTWLSDNKYLSLAGDYGQENFGFFTLLSFVVLFFVAVNNINSEQALKRVMGAFLLSGFFAGLFGLLQGLNIHLLKFPFSATPSFNTVGTATALGIFLAFVFVLCSGLLFSSYGHNQPISRLVMAKKIFIIVTALLSLSVIVVLDYLPITVSLLVASALLITYSFIHARSIKGFTGVMLPVAAFIASLMLLFFKFPLALNYPTEVMPSIKATTDIVVQTLRAQTFFGSGPGTFIFDYAKYHSADVNATAFWNIRFDRGATHFLTLLATIGLLGTLTWLMVSLFALFSAGRKLVQSNERNWYLLIGIFSAWLLLLVSKFLYSSTLTLDFAFWIMLALLLVVYRHDFYSVHFDRSPRAAMVVSFLFVLSVVFSVSGLFVTGQRYVGEMAYTQAVNIDRSGDIDAVLSKLNTAVNLNQQSDVYLRNIALSLLSKANRSMSDPLDMTKIENESNEAFQSRQELERDNRLRAASSLTADAINAAKRATELSPNNVANWSVLASVYRALVGSTDGAANWALQSYEEALKREPNNPALHTNIGDIYLLQAEVAAKKRKIGDEAAKTAAQIEMDELLGKATDSFNKAIELKGDYASAHFSLALTLDHQGKLKEAIKNMETAMSFNRNDIGIGFQLALLYYRDQQKDRAVELLESIVRLAPDYSNARWYLAAMYHEKGEIEMATTQLNKVAELNPNNEIVKRKLEELRKQRESAVQTTDENGLPLANGLPTPVE
jgi:tetratricopeptide (TPR) repeat protein